MARVRRPLPSSKGCRVTNQKCAMPARRNGSRPASRRLLSNQARKPSSCSSSPARGGASKCTVGRSSLPETTRSEEHTSELQSLMRNSYAVFCLKKQKKHEQNYTTKQY